MNKIYSIVITAVLFLMMTANFLSAQEGEMSFNTKTVENYSPDGIACNSGQVHDNGFTSWSNTGWNTNILKAGFCSKFIPTSYPYKFTKFCVAFESVTVIYSLKLYMYKSVNGKPGLKMDSLDISVYPGLTGINFYDFTLPATWKEVTAPDSVFFGYEYNPSVMTGVINNFTTDASLPVWPCYSILTGNWATPWEPGFKNYFMRAEGAPAVTFAHDYSITDFLSIPSLWKKDSTYTVKAKVKNTGSSAETNVPVKLFVDNVPTGTPVNLSLAPGGIDSVSFQWTPTVSAGAHRLKIASALTTDENKFNDTTWIDIRVIEFPEYYNSLNGTLSNGFPFGVSGKAINSIFLPGEFNHPSPISTGKSITKIYFPLTSGYASVVNNLTILLAQDTITSLTGVYSGNYDTVYNHSVDSLKAKTVDMFLCFTLGHPYPYDPAKSLILFIGQCSLTNGFYNVKMTSLTGNRRVFSAGGCPFTFNVSDNRVYNFGFDVINTVSVSNDPVIPSKYSLEQNYPNPFNPTTNIKYNVPKNTFVTLKVYDVMGREVRTLVNENKNAGTYEVKFDAGTLSSGMYLYKIQTGDFVETKNMILIK